MVIELDTLKCQTKLTSLTGRVPSTHLVPHPAPPPPLEGERIRLDDARAGRLELYAAASSRSTERSPSPLLLVHSINAAASAYEVRPIYERFAGSRPTYALDLPGFGRSDRSARPYTPRLMTDAIHAAVAEVRRRHDGAPVDALALSLACELLARAANEVPATFRSLALVSPTGFSSKRPWYGPPESTRGIDWMYAILTVPLWRRALFGLLTRPRVVRYFLRRTFGRRDVDEGLCAYAVLTARSPGAEHAPLRFLSGHLFSADVTRLYEGIVQPVWMCHGVRGDFVRYEGAAALLARDHWSGEVFDTGALPHFEVPDAFGSSYAEFLASVVPTR